MCFIQHGKNMKVITVANRKGGAGKSTLAAHISVEAEKDGFKTILIDMDPQKSLESWWNLRKEDTPSFTESDPPSLPETIEKLSELKFDLCVIDTPGDTSTFAASGIKVADLVVIPTKPTSTDLSAIGRTIEFVKSQGKKYIFVITQSIPNSNSGFEAVSILSDFGPVAPTVISTRACYYQAMGDGKSCSDFNSSAALELKKMWNHIANRLDLKVKTPKKKVA